MTITRSLQLLPLAGLAQATANSLRAASVESTDAAHHVFMPIDWIVLLVYVGLVLAIGFYYSRRQQTREEYFFGNRKMTPFMAGISIFTATTSVISYIAIPGEYVQFGPGLVFLVPILALPFAYWVVGWYAIPVIMRLPITSVYELLESRLGLRVRQAGSITYVITRLIWMALILYTGATVFVNMVGCEAHWIYPVAFLIGAITTTYTVIGGIRTVMVTEVIQFFMLLAGAVLTIATITYKLGGVSAWWPHHWQPHWPDQPLVGFNLHTRVILVVAFLSSILQPFCATMSDQASVQRFLTTRDAPAARRAYLLTSVATAAIYVVLGSVGAALLVYFHTFPATGAALDPANNGDAFFPYYISHRLPIGIAGLMVAAVMAAAMSCLAAGINSVITVVTKDFVDEAAKSAGQQEAQQLRSTRWLAIATGLAVICLSIVMGKIRGDLLEVTSKTVNLLVCPTFGLFFLAIFARQATPFGAIFGAVYSIAAAAVVGYWDVFVGREPISFIWIAPISLGVSLAVGMLLSAIPTRGKPPAVLATYSAIASAVLAGMIFWLRLTFAR